MDRRQTALLAFHTDEPFKAVAKRLGMSPNTLRPIWKGEFGETAFKARGKTLQAKAAAKTAKGLATNRIFRDVLVVCETCQGSFTLKANQVQRSALICDGCKYDRECPVCMQKVDGVRGLSGHFRHRREAEDEAHILYEQDSEDALWMDLDPDEDYVVCRECGHRARSLVGHLKAAHGLTAKEYRAAHPGVLIRARKLIGTRAEAIRAGLPADAYEGVKLITCSSCERDREVSKFFGSLHDDRCPECRAAEKSQEDAAYWEGKAEPADYVECRECGWKGLSLTGHLLGAEHPGLDYRSKYPNAPLFADGVMVFPTHKLHLTAADLSPFKDAKGRVQVALAAFSLGCSGQSVLRYCKNLGLTTRNRLATQKRVLDSIAEILGEPYAWEWWHPEIVNPKTGYHLYFDGRFEHSNLVIEYHGKQHRKFVPYWHKTEVEFERRKALDELKARRAAEVGLKLLVIWYDDPWADVLWLRGRVSELVG
jgi:Zn ribbon nucleic-acid-binding protein